MQKNKNEGKESFKHKTTTTTKYFVWQLWEFNLTLTWLVTEDLKTEAEWDKM